MSDVAATAPDLHGQGSVLDYWYTIELLSPPEIPKLDVSHKTELIVRTDGETPLPWPSPAFLPPLDEKKKWKFTVYVGAYSIDRISKCVEKLYGQDSSSFDRNSETESCLLSFQVTDDGRPLFESFVLASAPWALGRLFSATDSTSCWAEDFECAQREYAQGLAESFALRENDERGRELRAQGHIVGRPIEPGELEADLERVVEQLGVGELLTPEGIRIKCRQTAADYAFDTESDDFLNSFYLRDLRKVSRAIQSGTNSRALAQYLAEKPVEHVDLRADIGTTWNLMSPHRIPQGRWLSNCERPLYFSQQLAMNTAIAGFADGTTSLFSINGPPGTGKTTLLRDVIAHVIVERAKALAQLPSAGKAFDAKGHWTSDNYNRTIHRWIPGLMGFEVVVASSNNRAVENVTLEIPEAGQISDAYRPLVDYYADFGTRLLSEDGNPTESRKAWGLLAARLGNKKNRLKFRSSFWFENKEAKDPNRADRGFLKYLASLQPRPGAWKSAVQRFQAAVEREGGLRKQQCAAFNNAALGPQLREGLLHVEQQLADAEQNQGNIEAEVAHLTSAKAHAAAEMEAAKRDRVEHHTIKPNIADILLTLGRIYHEWRSDDVAKRARVMAAEASFLEISRAHVEAATAQESGREAIEALSVERQRLHTELDAWSSTHDGSSESAWSADADVRERTSPWQTLDWNQARNELFIEALHLHRAFIEAEPAKMKANLRAAMDILSGSVPGGCDLTDVQSAWATLFFVVPVASTTLASFDRLFSHVGCEGLGWLLIDEAGQAMPQAAAGALWRAKRALVVGDPRQLEPIVSLPPTAQQGLRKSREVAQTWVPSMTSVQGLCDRVNRYGTEFHPIEEDGPVWVGAPLRVHSRCQNPMFDISNEIAYEGQMVLATKPGNLTVRPSCWLDVEGSQFEAHWAVEEGVVVDYLLSELIRDGVPATDILLMSPFRSVADRLRPIGRRFGVKDIGTIHVSQGREAEIVLFVLGGNPARPGAKNWAAQKPNLLNVAVSRAKQRLYIIGNREVWRQQEHFHVAAAELSVDRLAFAAQR